MHLYTKNRVSIFFPIISKQSYLYYCRREVSSELFNILYPLIPLKQNQITTWQQQSYFHQVKIYRCLILGHKTGHIFNGGRFRGESNKTGSWCLWPICLWKATFSEIRARSFFIGTWARNTMNRLYLNPPAARKLGTDLPPTVVHVVEPSF